MATANNIKIKFNTETDEGKAGSQTFDGVSPDATNENISAVLDIFGGMQKYTVTGKQKITTENM